MKQIYLYLLLTGILLTSCKTSIDATQDLAVNNPIHSSVDLVGVKDDKVPVAINPGRFTQDTIIFRLPRVVQGTYAVSDFGSFIDDFKAFDYEGKELQTEKLDTNTWAIYGGQDLDKITYWVNDTFDIEKTGTPTPFSPSGTNIEPDNYVLNLHGFIGYFDLLETNSYTISISSPAGFDRTSALEKVDELFSEDGKVVTTRYKATRYFDVTDNPMMYGKLDVEEFQVGEIKIVLSVYSPNEKHSAGSLKETIFKMMEAQKAYLGDLNSTSRYDIYVYLAGNGDQAPTGSGALEHHTSTVVVMPESMSAKSLEEFMIDIVSHEFFHILSPLTVHSEDVHYFDYNQPTFSKHLWMYEGLTEYFATLFQINQDLVTAEDFHQKLMGKIAMASGMDDTMSFTEMSENVLDEPYASNYINVYQKGALIGMCLDILIREESKGEKGILWVMKTLSEKYGIDKPFEDDKIMDEIVAMTYPSVGEFFEAHVIGGVPIDYGAFFAKVGLTESEKKVETNYVMNAGNMIVQGSKDTGLIFFNDGVSANSFWHENGVKPGDVIKAIDGVEVTLDNANAVFGEVFGWEPGREISVILARDGKEVKIETTTTQSYTKGKILVTSPDASSTEKKLYEAWTKG